MDEYIEQQLDEKKKEEQKEEAAGKDGAQPALAVKRTDIKELEC